LQTLITGRRKIFSHKVFIERESLLTFKTGRDTGIRTLENIFIAFLILLGIQICVDEYFYHGNFLPDFQLFYWAFSKSEVAWVAWFSMCAVSLLVIPLVQLMKNNKKLSYCVWLPIYSFIQLTLLTIGISACAIYTLPPASGLIVSVEMARIAMKVHAYFREKVVNVVKKDSDIATFIPEWARKMG